MFTTPSKPREVRSSTPLASRPSRAGTPVFGSHDPISPPSLLSPGTFRRNDSAADGTAGDVSANSLFLSSTGRSRTSRVRPRPSSMLAASGPNVSLLNPGLDREGSVVSDDAEMRSVADTVHSYSRRTAIPPVQVKEANAQLEEGTVLLGDQWVHVSSYSRLPTEVTETLAEADLYIDAFQGFLDVTTGYACLLSRTQCFVWNYSSRGVGTWPACFVFPVPEYASSSMTAANDLSFACFLPRSGGGREPALLLVAPDGQICLWEGISSSLTRSDRAQRITAPLSNNETIVQLQRVDEGTVVLATSQSRLLRISVGSRAGMLQAEVRPFSQPRGLLGRIFGSTSAMGSNDVVASIAVAPLQVGKQGREVYAIGRKTLQKWQVLEQGGERLIGEQDVQQVVASAVLQQSEERYSAAESLAFDILDGAVQSDGKLVLLFSQSKRDHEPLTYGLAVVDTVRDAGSFVVASIWEVDYSTYPDPRPYARPSLSMPRGGPSAFITFADTVVAKQLEKGCQGFEEVIKLKDDVKNRFIGSGCDSVHLGGDNAIAALSLISATSGSLLVETSIPEIRKRCTAYTSTEDQNRADTDRLKGKLEQALYYSESPLNPLTFQLPAILHGTLMTAAERLSRELLTFSNPISAKVPPSVDLRTALKDRSAKMRFLVKFIAQCGHMEKLPQTTRRALRADAELACAMEGWWGYQNEFYSHNATGSGGMGAGVSSLAKAIESVMMENGLGAGEDVVRGFFRHHADLTTQVLGKLLKQAKEVVTQPLGARSRGVLELNRVVVGAFRAGLRYRKEFGGLYGVTEGEGGAAFEGWTAEPTSVQLLEALFSVTVNLIPDRTRELGSSIDSPLPIGGGGGEEQKVQSELKNQLCSLAELALACYHERLLYLSSAASSVGGGDSAVDRELSVFNTTYRSARPAFILPLVSISRPDKAFSLAEQYRDFRTLVQLCTDPNLLSSARLDTYLERYKSDFAFELYSYYLEQDRAKVLLEQKSEHHNLVSEYLQQTKNDRLAWLHDLALQRYSAASDKLEKLGLKENGLGQRKIMLSLAKLGYLSGLRVEDVSKVGVQKQVEFFDDHLDLIAVQESLVVGWENAIALPRSLPAAGTVQAAELCSEIVDTVATRLTEYPAYRSHYIHLVSTLLIQAKYLTSEDLIDLLTLKDTPSTQLEDFSTAIKVLIRAQDLAEQRFDAALTAIWTRAVIRDDWISLSETHAVSDQVVMQDLKATALYAVLREVLGPDGDRAAFLHLQSLLQAEQNTTQTQLLHARFQHAPDLFISLLMQDLEREKATLRGFLDDSDLPRLVAELAAVAAAEAEAEAQLTLTRGEDGGEEGDEREDSMLVE